MTTRRTRFSALLLLLPSLLLAHGCGTGVTDALLLAGESGARTFLDILLSDLLSDLPNVYTFPTDNDGASDNGSPDDGDDGGDDGTNGDDTGGLIGNATTGEATYMTNACGACHCTAASNCTDGLVTLEGADAARLDEKLLGEGFHAGGKFPDLTPQDLADLEAFLAG